MTRLLVLVVGLLCSCSHVVQIKMSDNSAADISVDGAALGKAPVNYTEDLSSKNSTYDVEAKLVNGKVIHQKVSRSETSMGAVGAGAGLGAGACLATNAVAVVAAFIIPFGGAIGCVGCLALVGGPVGGFLMGGQSPDVVSIDAGSGGAEVPPPLALMGSAPPALPSRQRVGAVADAAESPLNGSDGTTLPASF